MSLSILRPTNMSWVLVQGCICPRSDSVCIRPEDYTKPVECLNAAHLGSFPDHLLAKPCGTGNNGDDNNVLLFLFGFLLLIVQICIFWLLFISQRRNPVPSRRGGPRSGARNASSPVPLRRLPSPLAVGRKLRAEMGIAGGSGGGGGPRESAGNEVEEGMEVHSTD